jgi:Spy/CpxP family protein refolding chaperone
MKNRPIAAVIFSIAVLVILPLRGTAQQGGSGSSPNAAANARPAQASPGDKTDPDTPEADDSLNLTDDQKSRIKSIREEAQEQLKAMQKDKTLSEEQKQKKAKQLKMDTRKQVWSVLTPEQRTTWAEEARQRREAKKQSSPQ